MPLSYERCLTEILASRQFQLLELFYIYGRGNWLQATSRMLQAWICTCFRLPAYNGINEKASEIDNLKSDD